MTEKPSPVRIPVKGDDRNLVPSEASPAGPAFEDRLFSFWQNYRVALVAVVVVAFLVIVGRGAWNYYQEGREEASRLAFRDAVTLEQKQAFARDHAGHPLAAVALLGIADESYRNRDYTQARQQYAAAAAALKDPLLVARARLGEGVSALQPGVDVSGAEVLVRLGGDTAAPVALRTEAYYHLAALAVADGEPVKAREYLDKLAALEPVGIWTNRAASLRARLPMEREAPVVGLPGS